MKYIYENFNNFIKESFIKSELALSNTELGKHLNSNVKDISGKNIGLDLETNLKKFLKLYNFNVNIDNENINLIDLLKKAKDEIFKSLSTINQSDIYYTTDVKKNKIL